MAQERTQNSRYQSNYGGGWITDAQYLVECLCVLIAKQDRVELSNSFWKLKEWERVYRRQVPLALSLLKEYPVEVILAALRDRRCWKIKSLGAKWLLGPLLAEKLRQHTTKQQQQTGDVRPRTRTDQPPAKRPLSTTPSLVSRLRDI